ncbi:MAG: hypothetical protein QOE96_1744 [Blastocatellia bacterium]|jgi:hypothetical protein|nr:hypothetical protein [Blastocatellia bacterium]
MADTQQSYANHTRWHPPFHFFVVPVLLINFVWSVVDFVKAPGANEGRWIVVSAALVVLALVARTNALKVQDRIIRLEERLRYQQLLPADLSQQCGSLALGPTIALRFASDEELEGLVREVLGGRLAKPAEIKRAVKSWRADTSRV